MVHTIYLGVVPSLLTQAFLHQMSETIRCLQGISMSHDLGQQEYPKSSAGILKETMKHQSFIIIYLDVESKRRERAPWWDGIFERLLRLTKRCLRKIVGNVRLSYDELLMKTKLSSTLKPSLLFLWMTVRSSNQPLLTDCVGVHACVCA